MLRLAWLPAPPVLLAEDQEWEGGGGGAWWLLGSPGSHFPTPTYLDLGVTAFPAVTLPCLPARTSQLGQGA